jgi:hypothetical protein
MFNAPNRISVARNFYPGDSGKWSLLNFGNSPHNYMVTQPKRPQSTHKPRKQLKPQIPHLRKVSKNLSLAALWTTLTMKPFFEQLREDELHIISSTKMYKHKHYIQFI